MGIGIAETLALQVYDAHSNTVALDAPQRHLPAVYPETYFTALRALPWTLHQWAVARAGPDNFFVNNQWLLAFVCVVAFVALSSLAAQLPGVGSLLRVLWRCRKVAVDIVGVGLVAVLMHDAPTRLVLPFGLRGAGACLAQAWLECTVGVGLSCFGARNFIKKRVCDSRGAHVTRAAFQVFSFVALGAFCFTVLAQPIPTMLLREVALVGCC